MGILNWLKEKVTNNSVTINNGVIDRSIGNITIPYDELDKITVIRKDGTTEDIISGGRFVLPGIEELNKPFDR